MYENIHDISYIYDNGVNIIDGCNILSYIINPSKGTCMNTCWGRAKYNSFESC